MPDPLLMLFVDQLDADRETFVPGYPAHALVLLSVFSATTGGMNCLLTIYRNPGAVNDIGTPWQSPRATFPPPGPFSGKKGFRREADTPLSIAMVPKAGFDR
jgi:hypothetical protein